MSSGDVNEIKREPSTISTISVSSDDCSKKKDRRTMALFEEIINECYLRGYPEKRRPFTEPIYRRLGFVAPIGKISIKVTRLMDALKGDRSSPRWLYDSKRRDLMDKVVECAKRHKATVAAALILENKKKNEELGNQPTKFVEMIRAGGGMKRPFETTSEPAVFPSNPINLEEALSQIKEEVVDSDHFVNELKQQLAEKDAQIKEMTKALEENQKALRTIQEVVSHLVSSS